jgi:hypothetical protein
MKDNGFGELNPAVAVNIEAMPAGLQKLVQPWPG